MPSPQAQAMNEQLRLLREQAMEGPAGTLEEIRAAAEQMGFLAAEPAGVALEEVEVAGRRAHWLVPDGADPDAVLLYLHGGSYVVGSIDSHSKLVGHIASAAGCRALNFDYPLAPEDPHPAAVESVVAAYQSLLDDGFDPARIAIGGDSAGGGLALAALVVLRDRGLPLPAAGVLLSPWVDLENTGDTMQTNATRDFLVSAEALAMFAGLFLAGGDARDPYCSPLHADLRDVPDLYIQVGSAETLLDDSRRTASRAEDAGIDVTVDVFDDMQHLFQMAVGNVPEADDAVARIGAWLGPRLAG